MPFSEELAFRDRRVRHMGFVRLFLAAAYIVTEVAGSPRGAEAGKWTLALLFAVYAAILVGPRGRSLIRNHAVRILLADLVAISVLVLWGDSGKTVLTLLMFYFLLTEATLLHSAREVIAISVLGIVVYGVWLARSDFVASPFPHGLLLLLLLVGSSLAYFTSYRSFQKEREISALLSLATSRGESEVVSAVESTLERLATWLHCSGAILAVWDEDLGYSAIAHHPRQSNGETPSRFDADPEWDRRRSGRLDFYSNQLSEDESAGRRTREVDLHPFVIQKFEIYNCMSCGLFDGKKPMGRLLLYNSVSNVRRFDWRALREVSRSFRAVARHLLALKRTEVAAYEYESERIAHDLHDGALQSMISFEMRLEIIRRMIHRDPEVAETELESLQQFSRKLVAEMRTFVHRMRHVETDGSSLMLSARRLVDGFQKESGVAVTFVNGQEADVTLGGRLATELLQVIREAFSNIHKHTHATHVLFSVEQKNGQLYVSVHDNGRGFRFGGRYSLEELDLMRMGPQSIKQRVRTLGGDLSLESHPGQGSNLRVSVPL